VQNEMNKLEAKHQAHFNHWIREVFLARGQCGAFELKQTEADSISFDEVSEHQILNLQAAKRGKLVHKISDSAMGFKPFDAFAMTGARAYVVIRWPAGVFTIIDVDVFVIEQGKSKRKSLTYERAKAIAGEVV
jgi:hypothetical protein